jgi:CDP-glucose 4,6-dehydratase
MRFFVTGHTGFKGAWLVFFLNQLGHEVIGFSDEVTPGSLYEITNCQKFVTKNYVGDVRNLDLLKTALKQSQPDFIIHLAAQSLVRKSHAEPENTFEINVAGTVNVLAASKECLNLKGTLIVTTDKVYAPTSEKTAHREDSNLSGIDPYSASKVLADQFTQNWAKYVDSNPVSIARAGNVLGGGDVCQDRLIPEVFRSMKMNSNIELRFPTAVRPWQHVIDCLAGYLRICSYMLTSGESGIWNIGPNHGSYAQVNEVCEKLFEFNESSISWKTDVALNIEEATFLSLDSTKANRELGWSNLLNLDETLLWTSNWYKEVGEGVRADEVVLMQLSQYIELARRQENFESIF